MADRVDTRHRIDGALELRSCEASRRGLELMAHELGVIRADQAHLQRARACVDDEHPHRANPNQSTMPASLWRPGLSPPQLFCLLLQRRFACFLENQIPGEVGS